jgi:multiple sugar transport system permease protein
MEEVASGASSRPLARPGLATVGVLSFLWGWGDLVVALTLTSDESSAS